MSVSLNEPSVKFLLDIFGVMIFLPILPITISCPSVNTASVCFPSNKGCALFIGNIVALFTQKQKVSI